MKPELKYNTVGKMRPQGKPRIYFTCHPADFREYGDAIMDSIIKADNNVAVWYHDPITEDYDGEDLTEDLSLMQLMVVYVTKNFLYTDDPARTFEFEFARKNNIPVLPIIDDQEAVMDFYRICGNIDFISRKLNPDDRAPYLTELRGYLNRVIAGSDLSDKIKDQFPCTIFLSYRKKDRGCAMKVMNTLHSVESLRDAGIWFDDFLIPGEDYNDAILDEIKDCDLFLLVVTPSLNEEGNYVMTEEYQAALREGKKIIPIMTTDTDLDELRANYSGIADPIPVEDKEEIARVLTETLGPLTEKGKRSDPEYTYLKGLAYYMGVGAEINRSIGIELIIKAAVMGWEEAYRKVISIYTLGDGIPADRDMALEWQARYQDWLEALIAKDKSEENYLKLCANLQTLSEKLIDMLKLEPASNAVGALANRAKEMQALKYARADIYLERAYYFMSELCRMTGRTNEAAAFLGMSIELGEKNVLESKKVGEALNLALQYDKVGNLFRSAKNFNKAAEWYMKAYSLRATMYDEDGSLDSTRAFFISNNKIGLISMDMGLKDQARRCFDTAVSMGLEMLKETDDPDIMSEVARSISNLANMVMENKEYDYAENLYYLATDLHNKTFQKTKSMKAAEGMIITSINCARIPTLNMKVRQDLLDGAMMSLRNFRDQLPEETYNRYMTMASAMRSSLIG